MDDGVVDQMSFAFRVKPEGVSTITTCDEDGKTTDEDTILEVAELVDVCVCAQGAYPTTEAALRTRIQTDARVANRAVAESGEAAQDDPADPPMQRRTGRPGGRPQETRALNPSPSRPHPLPDQVAPPASINERSDAIWQSPSFALPTTRQSRTCAPPQTPSRPQTRRLTSTRCAPAFDEAETEAARTKGNLETAERAATARAQFVAVDTPADQADVQVIAEEATYHQGNGHARSFFADMFAADHGDYDARESPRAQQPREPGRPPRRRRRRHQQLRRPGHPAVPREPVRALPAGRSRRGQRVPPPAPAARGHDAQHQPPHDRHHHRHPGDGERERQRHHRR